MLGDGNEEEEQQIEATELRPVDYLQMMSQELATFEAEYQHIVRWEAVGVGGVCLSTDVFAGPVLLSGGAVAPHFVRDFYG